jgi:hypothetical protein
MARTLALDTGVWVPNNMAYRQDKIPRDCAICTRTIKEYEWMLDLFRTESAVAGSTLRVLWVHEKCAQEAIQRWLVKKMKSS